MYRPNYPDAAISRVESDVKTLAARVAGSIEMSLEWWWRRKCLSYVFFLSTIFLSFCLFAREAVAYTEQTLYSFCALKDCLDGSQPGEPTMDQAGNFYGTTYQGGATHSVSNPGDGVVFAFDASSGQYTVLYNFCSQSACADGANPAGAKLVIDTGGNLYGTTVMGGSSGDGVAFELVRRNSIWHQKLLYTFCTKKHCKDGAFPAGGLTYVGAADGRLYDGSSPLYGTTAGGGSSSGGTTFMLLPRTGTKKWIETVLYSFCSQANCVDGSEPGTPLLVDDAGQIYGTTPSGGLNGSGTVFQIIPTGTTYTQSVLYNFCAQANCSDGEEPRGSVVMDGQGNLYGSAGGGSAGGGVIYELSQSGSQWQYSVLGNFNGSNGSIPMGGLLLEVSGKLFGVTNAGGGRGKGSVFEFDGSIQSLYSFCPARGCPDGKNPVVGLIENATGNLFGATPNGGDRKSGTLYQLSP